MKLLGARTKCAMTRSVSILLASTALTTATVSAAQAADITISTNTNQTIQLDPLQSGVSTLTINSGVIVTAPTGAAIVANTAPWTVTNSGTLNSSTVAVATVALLRGGTFINNQTGAINNTANLGVFMSGGPSVVTNRGVINSVRSGIAIGDGSGTTNIVGSVINEATGRITSVDASGIIFQDPGSINIANAGLIEGGRQGVLLWAGAINNSGTIRSTGTSTFSDAITAVNGLATINNIGRITGSSFYQIGDISGIGSIGINVQAEGNLNLVNAAGAEVSGTIIGVNLLSSGNTITNNGRIAVTGAGGAIVSRGGNVTIINNVGGTIVTAPNPPAQYVPLNVAIVVNGANGVLTNSGVITGRVLMATNGTITNNAGARIDGNAAIFLSDTQPLIDQSRGFSGTLTNAGTITGNAAAATLTNTGSISQVAFGSTIINSGTIGAGVTMTPGNDSLTLRTGSTITGAVDAGAGTDTLILEGAGTAANVFSNFENLSMRGTEWTLSGNSTFGSVTVQSGFLNINGTVAGGPITLSAAGSGVRGSGRIDAAINNSAGTITPGGAGNIGTLTVGGNYTHGSGARLVIDANDAGQADRLTVTGAANLQGGVLQVAAVDAAWSVARTYTVLSAAGGLTGQFGSLDLNLPYLTPTLTYSANAVTLALARATADIQEDIVKETTEQQISTTTRKTTATVESRIDEVISLAFPMPRPESDEQSSMLPGASYGGITSLSAGDSMGGWGAWATLTPTFVDQDLLLPGQAAPQRVDGETWDMFAGVDKLVGQRTVIGAVAGFESSNYDLKGSNGERRAEGPLVSVYAGALLADWLYVTSQFNHAWFDNKLTESAFGSAPVTGNFDSKRWTGSASMTARHEIERVKLSGKVGYSYTRESFEAYRASDGTAVNPDRSRLGRVTIGAEAAYRGDTIMPYVLASFERDVQVNAGPREREGFVVGGGARVLSDRYSVDFYGNTETGRSGESAVSLGLNVRLAF